MAMERSTSQYMQTRDGVLGKKLLSVAAVPGTGDLVFLFQFGASGQEIVVT